MEVEATLSSNDRAICYVVAPLVVMDVDVVDYGWSALIVDAVTHIAVLLQPRPIVA